MFRSAAPASRKLARDRARANQTRMIDLFSLNYYDIV